jgi:hypothetical protein
MTARHSPLFTLRSGKAGLGIYTSGRDAALAGGCEQEQAIQKRSNSGPIAGSVAAAGDAPLQKADVIAYDTALLREESETTYASPSSPVMGLLRQRRRYADQLLLLLPSLSGWVQFTAQAAGQLGTTPMLRG